MTDTIRLALVGMGKIAHDQHVPAIAGNPAFELVATVSRSPGGVEGVPHFHDIDELAKSDITVDAVALCTPPQVRHAIAAAALANNWHVFLEKPPGATLAEVAVLEELAAKANLTLFASWHSRYALGVEPAREWLSARKVTSAAITWREDVRQWHPGQAWIWEAGGFGVFDPGINALSIATHIMPQPFFIERATLDFPANRDAPIAADVAFRTTDGTPVTLDLDWRQEGHQSWDIVVETTDGTLKLAEGGAVLTLPDGSTPHREEGLHGEYPGLYARFAELVQGGRSDVDIAPLRHVADAFMRGKRREVEDFVE